MSATLAMAKPTSITRPLPRKHHCVCGRYLGESTARSGYIVVKCQGCGQWRRVDFGVRGIVRP